MTTTMMTGTRNKDGSTALVVTAAGASARMGSGQKKEFLRLPGRDGTVLSAAVEPFLFGGGARIDTLVVTFPAGSGEEGKNLAREALFASERNAELFGQGAGERSPALLFVEGGTTRQESVLRALQALDEIGAPDTVLVHDGARPFVTAAIIREVLDAAREHGAATCAVRPVDTQKETDGCGKIVRHLDRSALCAVQTPQGFAFRPLLEAHRKAACDGRTYTDDTEIWSRYVGTAVHVTAGSPGNRKITFPGDLQADRTEKMETRTGLGYDLHRLESGRRLVIGGVAVPHTKGEAGHSDGDVLLHAVTDAVLGAAALGDIGEMFPPSDARWKDADSKELLRTAWQRATEAGWQLENLDCVVKLEKPKLLPFRDEIIKSIASILGAPERSVFVKAKTGEGLGFVGRGAAVEAYAACLLTRR